MAFKNPTYNPLMPWSNMSDKEMIGRLMDTIKTNGSAYTPKDFWDDVTKPFVTVYTDVKNGIGGAFNVISGTGNNIIDTGKEIVLGAENTVTNLGKSAGDVLSSGFGALSSPVLIIGGVIAVVLIGPMLINRK